MITTMNADQVIEQIRALSTPDDLERVGKALEDHRAEVLADLEAARRIAEIREGKVKAMGHQDVFGFARNRIREG